MDYQILWRLFLSIIFHLYFFILLKQVTLEYIMGVPFQKLKLRLILKEHTYKFIVNGT